MKHEITSHNTKKMLAETLKSLMLKKMLSKITVSEIVNICKINRKTFYYHFTDVYDLFEWQLSQEILEIQSTLNGFDDFDAILNFSLDYLEQNSYLLNCVNDPIVSDKLVQFFHKKFYPATLDVIHRLEQHHNKYLNEDYKLFLADLLAKITGLALIDTIKNKNTINREQLILYISDTFQGSLEGILHKNTYEKTEAAAE